MVLLIVLLFLRSFSVPRDDGLDFDDHFAFAERKDTLPPMDRKESAPPPFDLGVALREIAAIDDELTRMDTSKLTKRREELKAKIKTAMIGQQRERAVDEVSGYTAELQVRTSEQWDLEAFKRSVGLKLAKRFVCIQEFLDQDAIKTGVKQGTLSRAQLEVDGAVTKTLGSIALFVKPPKDTT